MSYLSSNPSLITDYVRVLKTERECPDPKVSDREGEGEGAERDRDAQLSPRALGSWSVLGAQHPGPNRDAGEVCGGAGRGAESILPAEQAGLKGALTACKILKHVLCSFRKALRRFGLW